ncbi:MAG TPA: MFS transporter [Oxalobacteraceae bacterium]|nr:MFS transporter [Oxalobacteraceae bacterium]
MSTQALDIHAGHQPAQLQAGNQPAYWGGVFAMTLGAFALVASEFMPVSLLTPVAADLSISEGLAGQAISVSGVFAVLTSLVIPAIAGKISRKALLLWLTGLMVLSAPIVALAPNYATYMAGRVLLGVAIGGFWSLSAAAAIRLVPTDKVPRALAVFNGGNALATVIAAPLGSYLGSIIGWRGAFFCLAPIAMLAFIWQGISLPTMKGEERPAGSGNVFKLLKNPLVALGMAAVSVFFMGQFALFTYLRPFLETVTGVEVSTLSLILLTIGVGGVIGTVLIGTFLQKSFYGTLIAIPILMAIIALTLVALGTSVTAVVVLLGVWGLVATAAPVGWWSWLARTLPENAEGGGGLMVAVVQLAIGLGSTVGGLLFDMSGYQSTFLVSAALLLLSAFLAYMASRTQRIQEI